MEQKRNFRKIIGNFLCWLGIHKLDKDEWYDVYGWNEEYLYSNNFCKRCDKITSRRLK